MAEVLIISGAGDYSDPWHRFGDTSLRLAEIIAGLGHQVTISDAVEKALADPGKPGLIVINIGNPCEARPQPRIDAAERGLDHHLLRGGALLGVHVSATSMTTMSRLVPDARRTLGARSHHASETGSVHCRRPRRRSSDC